MITGDLSGYAYNLFFFFNVPYMDLALKGGSDDMPVIGTEFHIGSNVGGGHFLLWEGSEHPYP